MNDTLINNLTAGAIGSLIQAENETYILTLLNTCVFALLVYTAILNLGQEIEYMWLGKFSLPALLYFFARYASLIQLGLDLGYNLTFSSDSQTTCEVILDLESFCYTLSYIGTQGLLVARAYSLCRGNKILAGMLGAAFFAGLGLFLTYLILLKPCGAEDFIMTVQSLVLTFAQSIINVFTDLLVSVICVWQVWGTWKLRREVGIRTPNDLVSIILKQSIIRLCFVIILSAAATIFSLIARDDNASTILVDIQNGLSVILVCDFTLDLRRRNVAVVEANGMTLPTLHFQSILQHVHQSLLVEMGTPEDFCMHVGDDDNNIQVSGSRNDGQVVEQHVIPSTASA